MVWLEARGPCSFQVAVAVSTAGVPVLGVWSRRWPLKKPSSSAEEEDGPGPP